MVRVCAVILGRGGSKGLPGKNTRLLGGHPLLAWSILAAKASAAIDRVICSTDSLEIAEIAKLYGAEVPFLRPAELASDTATDLDVFQHVVRWLDAENDASELLVQLRPTTPFRDPSWIDEAVAMMTSDPAVTSVRSVAVADPTPYKMWTLSDDGHHLNPLLSVPGMDEPFNMPRQRLPVAYWHTGQIDVIRREVIFSGSMTGRAIAPLIVSRDKCHDIDGLKDFQLAELYFDDAMPALLKDLAGKSCGKWMERFS